MTLTIITGKNILEGSIAVISLWFFHSLITKYCRKCSLGARLGISFGLTWIMRKFFINIYTEILKPRHIIIPTIKI